ncbi:hypothetical protein jhhlp_004072 [Lomentospora prolificans]|uniref:DNA (cytosine-5-)-methyltransferase n=1 Tax=Lomentospora prolificans TaxID=41688 RepID=A0A2N3NAI5_9PEZI|nr:hypothetical protein jhhlp_004072 [Lomentospora prolificans]
MIGAGPGECLPPFPEPSHSPEGGNSKPYVTARQALDRIRARRGVDPLHNPRDMRRANYRPWDGNQILPRCITTSGGQNYHFSGKRDLTLREFATLQGFPVYHVFKAPYIKKQIGNAFPPVVAEHLYRHIEKCLLQDDGILPRDQQPDVASQTDHAVVIEDGGDLAIDLEEVVDISSDEASDAETLLAEVVDSYVFAAAPFVDALEATGAEIVDLSAADGYDSDVTLGHPEVLYDDDDDP